MRPSESLDAEASNDTCKGFSPEFGTAVNDAVGGWFGNGGSMIFCRWHAQLLDSDGVQSLRAELVTDLKI
jgi:hypothetical protein